MPDRLRATARERKILLRRLAERVLPGGLDLTRKQGFSMPLAKWFKGDWGRFIEDVLTSREAILFDRQWCGSCSPASESGFSNTHRLFALTMIELWRRRIAPHRIGGISSGGGPRDDGFKAAWVSRPVHERTRCRMNRIGDGQDERFPFGRNWASFLELLDEERIVEAERSLAEKMGRERIAGATFLDVGSGSGLFSLAAMRLGARSVHSFDFDPDSVACTQELRRRYFPEAAQWTIEQGSALDPEYLRSVGQWDIVYSWGVLHHTGEMWRALDLVTGAVAPSGRLFIAIYNDQGSLSSVWTSVKRLYNRGGPAGRRALASCPTTLFAVCWSISSAERTPSPLPRLSHMRGMSMMHDWKDWLGGYPFEVAKPEAIFEFFRARGFSLTRLTTCGGGQGCNEFVFERTAAPLSQ